MTSRHISRIVLHATHSRGLRVSHAFCEFDLKVYRETNCFANYLRRGLQVITPLGHLSRQHATLLRGVFRNRALNCDAFFKTPGTLLWVPAPAVIGPIKRKNKYPLME